MVEKMPWGTREHLTESWFMDSPTRTWAISGGIPQTDPRFACVKCKLHFYERDTPLVFNFDHYDSFHCLPCAQKAGIVW